MSFLDPSRITIVLVETTQPGNIGAAARAMDNMGVTDLRLVNPCEIDHPEARMFAMSARYLLYQAKTYRSLREAVGDCELVIGTSARRREQIRSSKSIHDLSDTIQECRTSAPIAIVFGPEQSGLTNEHMSLCNEWVHIPTFGKVNSLNLAQSVVVFLYELSKLYDDDFESSDNVLAPASSAMIEGMKDHFFRVLERIGYLRNSSRDTLWASFATLIGRAKPDERDIRMLRGFFNRIEVTLQRESKKGDK